MFIKMELAGIYRYVTVYQVPGLEQLGWKRVPGADRGVDAEKPKVSQKSPKRKTK